MLQHARERQRRAQIEASLPAFTFKISKMDSSAFQRSLSIQKRQRFIEDPNEVAN